MQPTLIGDAMNLSYFEANHLIKNAHRVLEHCTHTGLEGLDLSAAQFHLLDALASGRAHSPMACSRVINLTPSGVTHVLNALEARGLIARVQQGTDRRFITLRLHPLGQALHERAAQAVSAAWAAALERGEIKTLPWLMPAAQVPEPNSEKAAS